MALNEIFLHAEYHPINWNIVTTSRRKVVLKKNRLSTGALARAGTMVAGL
jgi:hypothetical protein